MTLKFQKAKPELPRRRGGFTLIEVIATVVLSSILIALMLPLINSGLQGNRRPLLRMPATYSLRTDMDAWWQLYRETNPTDLPVLSAAINAAAAADPPPSYNVLYNGWVDFDATGAEFPAPGTENVLRVTLGNAQGERLTAYFFPIP